ncbi:MAG: hypothetical protein R3249_09505 [Nitriliruptorales bacterium]|nr:hypothetical protein [Nitriliruptorales bacterium]
MKIKKLLAVGAAAALVLTACDDGADPESTESPTDAMTGESTTEPMDAEPASLAVTATDDGEGGGYAFEVAATVESGATSIELTNTGSEGHHAQVIRMNDGLTIDDFVEAMQTGGEAAALATVTFPGGTGSVDPGGSASATGIVDLTPGAHAFVCFVPGPDGLPHVANGMLQPFEVVEAAAPAPLPEGETVSLADYNFVLPATIAGDATLSITNDTAAGEPHEMNMMRLADGATPDDVFAWFESPEGPPPFSSVGGLNALFPGGEAAVELSLEAGSYMFVCFIPSVLPENEGKSHAELGMVTVVEVT